MEIRFLEQSDQMQVGAMYNAYFSDMEYPDFFMGYHCVYVVQDGGEIIAVGGLKPIVEAVVLSDQSKSVRQRRDALMMIYNALTYSSNKLGYKKMYAFTYDETYAHHLVERIGFQPINKSKLLVLEL